MRTADTGSADSEAQCLLAFLQAQRSSVLAIVEGLDEQAMRTAVVPSGWTPVGLIGHLGFAERHWFQQVATGTAAELPWAEEQPDPAGDDAGTEDAGTEDAGADDAEVDDAGTEDADRRRPFTTDRPVAEVIGFYRNQCARADQVLASMPLSAAPRGALHGEAAEEVTDLRWIVLHMIEETARHAGHLDIARELLDGRTGLGPR